MTTIITRSGKGSPLTNTEVDNNFTNLNTYKFEGTPPDSIATPSNGLNGIGSSGWFALDGYGAAVPNHVSNNYWVGVFSGGSATRGFQIASGYTNNQLTWRTGADGWLNWRTALSDANFSSYALPLSGGTLTGGLNLASMDQGAVLQHNGDATQWYGRILSKNSTSNKAAFIGTYGSIAGVFSHNNALDGWADLYVNTVNGSSGGTVRIPNETYMGGNLVLNSGNYTSYAMRGESNRPTYDLNNLINPGNYGIGNSDTNRPADWGSVIVGRSSDVIAQWYGNHENNFFVRGGNPPNSGGGGVWNSWRSLLHSGNYSSYALPLSGGTLTGGRPMQFDTGAGAIFATGDSGGWSMGHYYKGSNGSILAGFGAYGGGSSLNWAWIGTGYDGAWMTINASGANFNTPLKQGGYQVLHAANYTSFGSIIRGIGNAAPGATVDWNSIGNTPNTISSIYNEQWGGTGAPPSKSYTYGTILSLESNASAQAQFYISHSGNDFIWRGGWAGGSWQTWNKALSDQNYGSYALPLSGGTMTGNIIHASGTVDQYHAQDGTERGYIGGRQNTGLGNPGLVIATTGGESIAFKDGGLEGDLNVGIAGDGTLYSYRALTAQGPFYRASNTATGAGVYYGTDDSGIRDVARVYKSSWNANNADIPILRVSTDWNDWVSTHIEIEGVCDQYSGGGTFRWYWRLGYGTNTITTIYSTGQGMSRGLRVDGPFQVSGAPADCQYFNLVWLGGYYESMHFTFKIRYLSLVSSISWYMQAQVL